MKVRGRHIIKGLKISGITVGSLLLLVVLLSILLQTEGVQGYLKKYALGYWKNKTGTEIKLERFHLSLWSGLEAEGLFAEDQSGDTLLYVGSLKAMPKIRAFINEQFIFKRLHLNKLNAKLYETKPGGDFNFQYIIDAFATKEDTSKEESDIYLSCNDIKLTNSSFSYRLAEPGKPDGKMNFEDLAFKNINLFAQNFLYISNSLSVKLDSLNLREKSGFKLEKLRSEKIFYGAQKIQTDSILLKTPASYLAFHKLRLKYPNTEAFSSFTDSVDMFVHAQDTAFVNLSEARFFTSALDSLDNRIGIAGKIIGKVSRLQTQDLALNLDDIVNISFDSEISNLPDFSKLHFNLMVNRFRIDLKKLKELKLYGDSALVPELPEELDEISRLSYQGNTRGETQNFTSDGTVDTNIGNLSLSLNARKDSASVIALKGLLKAEKLALNKVIGNNEFGNISFFQNIKLNYTTDSVLKVQTQGDIDSLTFRNFTYRNVKLFAEMNDMRIDSASVLFNQKHVQAGLTAKADFNKKIPDIAFRIFADTLNLRAMNIQRKYNRAFLAFGAKGDFSGIKLKDFEGKVQLTKAFVYKTDSMNLVVDSLHLSGTTLNAGTENYQKQLLLSSDIVEAKLIQQGDLQLISKSIENKLSDLLPTFFPAKDTKNENENETKNGQLQAELLLKDPYLLAKFINPAMRIARNSKLTAFYKAANDTFGMKLDIAAILYDGMHFDSVAFTAASDSLEMNSHFACKKFEPASRTFFKNIAFNSNIRNDSISYELLWDNKDSIRYSGDIKGELSFSPYKNNQGFELNAKLLPSELTVADSLWEISETHIKLDSIFLNIADLQIKNKNQSIKIHGTVITDPENAKFVSDKLSLEFSKFEIENLKPLFGEGLDISGQLTGNSNMMQMLTEPVLIADNTIKNVVFNDISLGKLSLKTAWDATDNHIKADMFVEQGSSRQGNQIKVIETSGYYKPDTDSLKLSTQIKGVKAVAFEKYVKEYAELHRNTRIDAEINIDGTSKNLNISGSSQIRSFYAKVIMLNTRYSVTEGEINISFDNKKIEIEPVWLNSGKRNNKAKLQGLITHNNFDNFKTDIFIELDKLQLNNTPPTDTAYFYGQVYGSGEISISGSVDDLLVKGNIETGENTRLHVPPFATESLEEETGFIEFVSEKKQATFADSTENESNYSGISGMTINLGVKITPDAEILLIMDESTGDNMRARGTADMRINMDTRGDITTYGDFIIEKGEYNFSLEGLINKKFSIKQGSKISLHGNPEEDGKMDITAVYTLRKVPVHNLMAEEKYIGMNATAHCIIEMEGDMMQPDLQFDVILDNVEDDVAQQVRNLDTENKNVQFLSLLMIDKFQPLPGFSQEVVGGSPVSTGDVLTAQVNRMLSDISDDFDLGVNYEQGDQRSRDEVELALSTNLWDDRLTINTNVGVGGQAKEEAATEKSSGSVVGEVEAEIKLNRQGSMKMKVYNRANDDLEYDKAPYTQGIGLFWRKEFDRIRFRSKKNEKKDSTASEEDD